MRIKIDRGIVCDSGKEYLYAINMHFLGYLFTLQLRSYQTDKPYIRFSTWKVS